MQWMSGNQRCEASFAEFAALLGYEYLGDHSPVGTRMHVHGTTYDKNILAPLYGPGGKVGEAKGLSLLYNILLRMFRENIAPAAGNLDAIRGGLVNLMHQAYSVFLAGPNAPGSEIDVMDFIFNEMHIALLDRKTPPYAPYVMRLICSQASGLPLTVTNLVIHKSVRPQ
jgi:hypothetical protein